MDTALHLLKQSTMGEYLPPVIEKIVGCYLGLNVIEHICDNINVIAKLFNDHKYSDDIWKRTFCNHVLSISVANIENIIICISKRIKQYSSLNITTYAKMNGFINKNNNNIENHILLYHNLIRDIQFQKKLLQFIKQVHKSRIL
jgi:hypothetical protein